MKKIKCIFLIDDCEIDIWLGVKVIKRLDISLSVITARNGEEALRKLGELILLDTCFPEIFLVDINMPLLNGFEFIQRLKNHPMYSESQTKIILITSDLDNDLDIPKIIKNKIWNVLVKPINELELLKMIFPRKVNLLS